MREDKFYDICDSTEQINENVTEDYFPTCEEIDNNINAYGLENQLEIIAYFASNPFKRLGNAIMNNPEYQKTVAYCLELLGDIPLQEEV